MHIFPLIKQYAGDGRNFVKKAVNWALRAKRCSQERRQCARSALVNTFSVGARASDGES
jgi:3-methyladenine DNA glycosylase AlkD